MKKILENLHWISGVIIVLFFYLGFGEGNYILNIYKNSFLEIVSLDEAQWQRVDDYFYIFMSFHILYIISSYIYLLKDDVNDYGDVNMRIFTAMDKFKLAIILFAYNITILLFLIQFNLTGLIIYIFFYVVNLIYTATEEETLFKITAIYCVFLSNNRLKIDEIKRYNEFYNKRLKTVYDV